MKRILRRNLVLGAPLLVLSPTVARAAADDLVVIVHKTSDVRSLSRDELEAIFTTRRRYWSGSRKIIAFNLLPKTTERVNFDRAVLRLEPPQVSQLWIDRKIRGGAAPPRSVPDGQLLLRLVAGLPDSIGYVPAALASADVHVVARVSRGSVASSAAEWFDFGDFV